MHKTQDTNTRQTAQHNAQGTRHKTQDTSQKKRQTGKKTKKKHGSSLLPSIALQLPAKQHKKKEEMHGEDEG
jgi:hypothetical protein